MHGATWVAFGRHRRLPLSGFDWRELLDLTAIAFYDYR
jgi:hypothetical protein